MNMCTHHDILERLCINLVHTKKPEELVLAGHSNTGTYFGQFLCSLPEEYQNTYGVSPLLSGALRDKIA